MSDSNPGKPTKGVGMGNTVIAAKKTEEVKSKTDPMRVRDGATSRGERFVLTLSLTEF